MRKSEQEKIVTELNELTNNVYNILDDLKRNCNDLLDYNLSEENHDAIYEMWEFANRSIGIYNDLKRVPDEELEKLILVELEKMLGFENATEIPQHFIDTVREDIQSSSDYPNYNNSDVTIAVRRNVLNAIEYWAD